MKKKQFTSIFAAAALAMGVFTACDNDTPNPNPEPEPIVYGDFQLIFANGTGNPTGTIVQGVKDVSTGEITFAGRGYEMTSSRTARVFISDDGSTLYSLNYTQGTVDKLLYHSGQNYTKVKSIDASIPLGVKQIRMTKLSDKEASLHYITSQGNPQFDPATGAYLKHKMELTLGLLNLETLEVKEGFQKALELNLPANLAVQGYFISRIDAPVLSGSKLYYGANAKKYNPQTGKEVELDRTFTVVVDYPSLTNATVIENSLVSGTTNGYRMPTQHKNEAGEILQIVSTSGTTSIVKIVNGQYNTTYKYDLHTLLGKKTRAVGWFYAGNGIGYIPYEDFSTEQMQTGVNSSGNPTYSYWWKLARVDLNNNTVVDLDVPDKLWLFQYQASTVRNGKFYIALTPVGVSGNVYIFDINSTNAKGTLGASITAGADQLYIGIY